jgi:hypothetical protein
MSHRLEAVPETATVMVKAVRTAVEGVPLSTIDTAVT